MTTKKPRRFLLRLVVYPLLLLFLLAGGWAWAYLHTSHELDSTIGNLEREGYATSLRDLAPPPVPPEESTTEAYKSALAEAGNLTLPEKLEEMEHLSLLPESDRAEIGSWLKENREAIDAVGSAGDPRKCRFEWKYEDGYGMETGEITLVLPATRAICLQAQFHALQGDAEKARKSLSAATNLYLLFESEPVLTFQLVRAVVHGLIFDTVNRCITVDTPEKELEAWLEFVEDVPPFEGGIQLGFRGELALLAALVRDPSTLNSFLENEDPIVGWGAAAPLAWSDGAYCLRQLRRSIELAGKPYLEAKDELVALQEETLSGLDWKNPLTALIFPAIASAQKNEASAQCGRLVVRTGILCELSRLRDGKYPAETGAIDPLTGKPLAYSPEEGWIRTGDGEKREVDAFTWKLRGGKHF